MAANQNVRANAFYDGLAAGRLSPLWAVMRSATPKEPNPKGVPHIWKWANIRPQILEAGDLLTAWEAERRVLMLINPSFEPTSFRTVGMIYAGVQLILPGEKAPTHRHVPNALRFIIEGEGAYTTVDGERTLMSKGDFVTTPNWTWHDHGNETDRPMMWLDGLDLPFVNAMDVNFAEEFGTADGAVQETVRPLDDSQARWGRNMRPAWMQRQNAASPLLNYRWQDCRSALHRLRDDSGSPADGVILQYINPLTGGPVLPTIASFLQLIRRGQCTKRHRHTSSAIYFVAEGEGRSFIGDEVYDWQEGDVFVVPSWTVHAHESRAGEAVLFSYSDRPIIEAFGFYREEQLN